MKLGSLFSGAGLGDLGWLMAGMDIRWQCEIDEYCQKVLELRFPETKKYKDVRGLVNEELEPVDIVAGGFPCQPFSVAGKQRGDQDDRNLWPAMFEVVKKVRPAWVVGENVSGIIPLYLDTVLADLESACYSCRTFVFPAHAIGASHRRERIWIMGYSGRVGQTEHEQQATGVKQSGEEATSDTEKSGARFNERVLWGLPERRDKREEGMGQALADSNKMRPQRRGTNEYPEGREGQGQRPAGLCGLFAGWKEAESRVCRVTDGCPNRVDRLKALGNGQVVGCTAFIGQLIMEFDSLTRRKA